MQYPDMQEAIKSLTEDEKYRNSLETDPDKLISDFNLDTTQWQALNSTTFTHPRVAITKETGMACCSICTCAPPLRRN